MVRLPQADGNAGDARLSAGFQSTGGIVAAQHRLAAGAPYPGHDAWRSAGYSLGVRMDAEPAHAVRLVRRRQRHQGLSRRAQGARAGTSQAHVSRRPAVSADSRRRGANSAASRSVDRTRVRYAGRGRGRARADLFAYRRGIPSDLQDDSVHLRRRRHRRALSAVPAAPRAPAEDHQPGQPRTSALAAPASSPEQRRSAHRPSHVDQLCRRRSRRDRVALPYPSVSNGESPMSFTNIEPATPRLHRSELAVPGSNTALFEKAAKSAADIVFLDVEDAVAPDDKEQARNNIIQGLNTHYMYRDLVDIVEACPRLDMILIPKAGVAADVYAVDMMVTQIEAAKKRTKRIGFEVLIETALGMANVEAIA